METLSYLVNTVPNVEKMRRNLNLILPYVDHAVVCIGERDQQAEEYFKTFDKVTLVYYPWDDSFKNAYQACLDHAPQQGWQLRLDDDEVPSEEMLRSLRPAIEQSNQGQHYDVVCFPCTDVHEGVISGQSDYHREMLYKWNPQLHYEIDLHQALVGLHGPAAKCQFGYFHHKSALGSLSGACRDFFIAGVWADHKESFEYWYKETGEDPRVNAGAPLVPQPQGLPYPLKDGFRIDAWHEMKDILSRRHPEVQYYRDLNKLMRSGEIHPEFREWALNHGEEQDKRPHLHELHAFAKYLELLQ